MEYDVVIGLEVHAELSTKTKIYCGCKNSFGLEVNTQCCPICAGMPGTLPVLNEKVVEYAVKMGHALNCNINKVSKQDRKNYFYPDLPKAYQISQAEIPICENGYVDVPMADGVRRVGITRIHIEEDAGKLVHDASFEGSLVDFNRCGVPLIEIVSEPDIRSAAEAKAYLETLQSILKYIDISDCKMQEGSIRCDVNVSVKEKGSDKFGTRCEMKNVNSWSGAYRAIEYEAARQIAILENGGVVNQETRKWDDAKGESILLRSKEDAHDYRYFPEPDLLTVVVPDDKCEEIRSSIPELPNQKIIKYTNDMGIPFVEASVIAENQGKAEYFEECVRLYGGDPKTVCNWVLSDLSKIANEKNKEINEINVAPETVVEIIKLVDSKKISNTAGKTVLDEHIKTGKTPYEIIDEKQLAQISDNNVLVDIAKKVLSENQSQIEQYKNGKTNILGYFVGQCMKASRGQGNPALLKDIILELLEEK